MGPAAAEAPEGACTGVCIHWSGIRGFGILRSQVHGEVFCETRSLRNCSELSVGDVVAFQLGYDRKTQKSEALNCHKAGVGGRRPPDPQRPLASAAEAALAESVGAELGSASITVDPKVPVAAAAASCGSSPADVKFLSSMAVAAAVRLLSQDAALTRSRAPGAADAAGAPVATEAAAARDRGRGQAPPRRPGHGGKAEPARNEARRGRGLASDPRGPESEP
eukprot:CAMPEP_0176261042 /NCGR_PEP_ID=MMETSP0121_2-20121125/39894_1 /TAXON_ID=160619 /ORGANISM="Kryptoperidinium foliaceum, Strain CCMP 1326" /LENGTH=221 /DNA_ID=CAMNT_0017600971 /DNA_START=9 /DNA_END=671 /DNA_ORIENTATION=+